MSAVAKRTPVTKETQHTPFSEEKSPQESAQVCAIKDAIQDSDFYCAEIITPDMARTRRSTRASTYMFLVPKKEMNKQPIPQTRTEGKWLVDELNLYRADILGVLGLGQDHDKGADRGYMAGDTIHSIAFPHIELQEIIPAVASPLATHFAQEETVQTWNVDVPISKIGEYDLYHTIHILIYPDAFTAQERKEAYVNGKIGTSGLEFFAGIEDTRRMTSHT